MSDDFPIPGWAELAAIKASTIQERTNAFWLEQLGELGQFGGFQVHTIGDEQTVTFRSVLYGGRSIVGDAREIQEGSRAYVLSRRRGRAKGDA